MRAACRGSGAIAGVFSEVVEEVRAAASVYPVGNASLSLGTTGTIGRFQVVERTPVTER